MVTSDFTPEVEIWPFRACAMHSSLYEQFVHCGRGYGRYHVPQNAFLVIIITATIFI